MPDSPSKIEPDVTPEFAKNAADEAFLAWLNDTLAGPEVDTYSEDAPDTPVVFIVGLPRSGTTVASQILAAGTSIGYVDNLAAAFWRAPVTGLKLSRKLLGRRDVTFSSKFGRTDSLGDPHEFGYFWSAQLGYRELHEPAPGERCAVDWDRLRLTLNNMSAAVGRVLMFKNFQIAWYAKQMLQALPHACLVHVTRDPSDNALSLLKMRELFLGDRNAWASMKPANYDELKKLDPIDQVAAQVVELRRGFTRALAGLPPVRRLDVQFEDLVREPRVLCESVAAMVGEQGGRIDLTGDAFQGLGKGISDHREDRDRDAIQRAVADWSARD